MRTKDIMREFVSHQISFIEFRDKLEELLNMDMSAASSKMWLSRFINAHFIGNDYAYLYRSIQQF